MSNNDFLPREDSQLQNWLDNFITACSNNEEVLGLAAEQIGQITLQINAFDTGMTNVTSTKAAAKSAVTGKNTAKSTISSTVRTYAKQFKADPSIPASVLSELGIVSNAGNGPVVTVTSLTVIGCDDGVNKLKWDRNSNASGTLFIIEYKLQGQANWGIAGAVTKSTFDHVDQVPGQTVYYRVVSTRGGQTSNPTASVVAYGNTSGPGLSIAA